MSKTKRPLFQLDADLLTLRTLIAVVEEGSFSAAAQRIGRTQSAVSLQIAKLEERIQVRLLERSSRMVRQTPAGETFTAYARRITGLADEALAAVSTPELSEPIRLGVAEYLVPQHLHQLLTEFKRAHPNVGIGLSLGAGYALYRDLQANKLDLVVAGPESDEGQLLYEEPLVWVGPKEGLPQSKGGGEIDTAADPLSLILMPPPCSYRQAAFDALTDKGLSWQVTVNANSVQGIQSAVAAGFGISVMARSAVSRELRIIDAGLPALPLTRIKAYWNTKNPHPLTERFLAFLKQALTAIKVA